MTDDQDHIDTLIDDVAREMTTMTSAQSDADFARRVSRRIADTGERRGTWLTGLRPWVLAPIAAAIVLVVAVMVVRRTPETVRPKPDATESATVGLTFDSAQGTPSDSRGVKADTTYVQPVAALPRIVSIVDAPAPAVEPIEIHALDVQPLVEMDEIAIGAIAIDRIEIAAMP